MWHYIFHGHFFKPHIIRYDRYGFGEYDGCEKCMGIEP